MSRLDMSSGGRQLLGQDMATRRRHRGRLSRTETRTASVSAGLSFAVLSSLVVVLHARGLLLRVWAEHLAQRRPSGL